MASRSAKPRSADSQPRLRGRIWVEIGSTSCFTEAGADLLEQIEACGSLSEGARRLRFSYRRAWLLVDAMNRLFPEPLVTTAIGGKHGGGTHLTEMGQQVLRAYRDIQVQVGHMLEISEQTFNHILSSSKK